MAEIRMEFPQAGMIGARFTRDGASLAQMQAAHQWLEMEISKVKAFERGFVRPKPDILTAITPPIDLERAKPRAWTADNEWERYRKMTEGLRK